MTLKETKRIAAVHDISGMGRCSLTMALPVISASGVECSCLPTALLSTHTGGFTNFTFKDLSEEMLPIARHWRQVGAEFDGVYSGYLASAAQAELLKEAISIIRTDKTRIIVDPVMADNGSYYSSFGDDMCEAFKRLCAEADIITPNITEAALMTGVAYEDRLHSRDYINTLLEKLGEICHGVIALTGVRPEKGSIGAVAYDTRTGEKHIAVRPVREGTFHGTGDLFASAFSSLTIRGASLKDSTETAIMLVGESIDRTVMLETPRRNGVDFEGALPKYILQVAKLFAEDDISDA